MTNYMHIILMGIQGAGKGTQAANILENFDYIYLESGGLLRDIIEDEGHKHNSSIKSMMENGEMVPDEIIFELIGDFFKEHEGRHILIDGAVRTVAQKEFLDKITRDYIVINLNLDKEHALARIRGRKLDPVTKEIFGSDFGGMVNPNTGNKLVMRKDDQDVERIEKRFSWYEKEILPLLDVWRAEDIEFYEVDGSQTIEEVWTDISELISSRV